MPTTESNPSSSAAGLANIDTIEAAMPSNQNSSSENLISTDENHDNDDNDDEEAETTEQPVTDSSFSAFTLGNHSTGSQEAVVATTNISMATSEIPREDATEESDTMATVTMETEANDHGSTEEPVLVTTEVTTTLYDPCSSSPCQNGGLCDQTDGNFTCECRVGFEGEFCSDNIDDCVLSPCDNGGQCIDQVNGYLCVCMSGWNGINCTYNIDECSSRDLNDCSENANCTDTEGSYHCACHDGYSGDGKICAEIDECSSNPCMNGATCLNKLSRYECRCTMGWNGTHCEQDVDECSSGVAVCDAAAECTNLDGSYRCECHDGFRGDGYTCTEIMLYPYQHSGARTLKGDDVFTEAIPFLEGFPFFGKFYTKFYVNMNGYISFDKPYQHSAPMKPFPVPAGQAILAPFWSDIDTTHGTGAVYYQSYSLSSSSEGRDLIAKVTRHIQAYFNVPDFNATYLFIATWHRVPPYPSKTYADIETALFQVAIATDRNLSYAVFNYDLGGMLWHSGNVEDRSVQVGYSDGGSHYHSLLESFTRDVYQMDEVIGNSTGQRGRLAFDLNVPGQYNPNIPCYDWYKNRPDLSQYIRASEPCPCSLQQARMDPRYEVMNRSFCAGSLFWKAGTRQQCCYDEFMLDDSTSTGLLTGTPRGGTIMVESMEDFRVKGFQECCQRSDYCHLYYSVFPSDDCSRYRPVASALSWGDPHLITLDNYKYTFNGMGEYTIVDVDNQFFVLQGRTEAAPSIGNRTTATVFSAFAAKQNGSETVQIEHIPGTEDVQISIDGTENKKLSEIEEYQMEKFTDVVLIQNQEKLQCIFSSGISVQITASYNMLTASVVLPESFHGRTSGLVGLWNGDMADDFLLPNGTVMYPKSGSFSDQEIFTFGQMWQIEEAESLFTYGNGTNYTHYRNDDFQPLFFGSIDEMFEGIEDMKNASVDLCGENMACLFDIAATGNITMGEVTALAETTYNSEKEIRGNYPPIFSSALPSRLEMKTTKDYSMTLDASDMNGDPISFAVWSNFVPQDSIRGSEFSWTPELPVNLSTPIVLYFTASDGSGAAIYNPDVWICACQNGGNCTFGEGDNFAYTPHKSRLLHC
ncbi:mucin-like protein isoform X2 [Ptychodera flava]|uniref:mucin-like protein isoform X2 n=1 Tax=Ptychodera flava TaxID=63121 RepID=UPI003969F546